VNSDFDQFVDTDDLSPDDRRRLQQVHELLVAAGPPPELPVGLQQPPVQPTAPERRPRIARRPRWAVPALAAALAAAAFGGGYVLANDGDDKLQVERVLALEATPGPGPTVADRSVSIAVGAADAAGNRVLELSVSGLPRHADDRGYYELFLERDGKPFLPCGGFKVKSAGEKMTLRFVVPYSIDDEDTWVLTTIVPGEISWPGDVLMRTV
jgi:hypothetical protein